MKLSDALAGVSRLFIDTAPVIYFVEKHPHYAAMLQPVFDRVDNRLLLAVTSPVTLAECLVHPYRRALAQLQRDFIELLTEGESTLFLAIDQPIARQAAQLRARHNLALDDAFQIATALSAGCEAFLTNDAALQRVSDLRVVVLDELEPD